MKLDQLSKIDSENIYLFAAGFSFIRGCVGSRHWTWGRKIPTGNLRCCMEGIVCIVITKTVLWNYIDESNDAR